MTRKQLITIKFEQEKEDRNQPLGAASSTGSKLNGFSAMMLSSAPYSSTFENFLEILMLESLPSALLLETAVPLTDLQSNTFKLRTINNYGENKSI